MSRTITLTDSVSSGANFSGELYNALVMERSIPFATSLNWASENIDLSCIGEPTCMYRADATVAALFEYGDDVFRLYVSGGIIYANVASTSLEKVNQRIDSLKMIFPVQEIQKNEKRIPLYLWTATVNGPKKVRRVIDVPTFADIKSNYSSEVQSELERLYGAKPESGKIILWHGPPGTGKSYALRALGYEWKSWADVHYIGDPETLFGNSTAYLFSLLFDEEDSLGDRYRVLVLEDTGEMLTADAKQHVGQGLSRLLNVTDGLLGQGLRIIVLVTTNEDVGDLHPAVKRPGRCASNAKFGSFSKVEANQWLRAHGSDMVASGETSLAELYSMLEGNVIKQKRSAGFQLGSKAAN